MQLEVEMGKQYQECAEAAAQTGLSCAVEEASVETVEEVQAVSGM